MIEQTKATLHWVREQYRRASPLARVIYGLLLVLVLTVIGVITPFFTEFRALFAQASPFAQAVIMMFLFIACVYSLISQWERSNRVEQLKVANKELESRLTSARQELESKNRELALVEERWTRLAEVETREIIWQRPDHGNHLKFLPKEARCTRFVSFLNLKGGVGKTTLTANLAACLALMANPLRVLVLDIDFQGTLSDQCVDPQLVEIQVANGNTVAKLLAEDNGFDLLQKLTVPMNQVPRTKVVIANDQLETEDFRAQANYFLDQKKEVRFFFRSVLHQPEISHHYDVVFFDCPPRLTASAINALTCSDFVVVPTKLDDSSISAVPRTLKWMDRLANIVQAKLLAVVANETEHYDKKLTRQHANSYQYLNAVIAPLYPGNLVCKQTVKSSSKAVSTRKGLVACVDPDSRAIYMGLAEELRGRMGL